MPDGISSLRFSIHSIYIFSLSFSDVLECLSSFIYPVLYLRDGMLIFAWLLPEKLSIFSLPYLLKRLDPHLKLVSYISSCLPQRFSLGPLRHGDDLLLVPLSDQFHFRFPTPHPSVSSPSLFVGVLLLPLSFLYLSTFLTDRDLFPSES